MCIIYDPSSHLLSRQALLGNGVRVHAIQTTAKRWLMLADLGCVIVPLLRPPTGGSIPILRLVIYLGYELGMCKTQCTHVVHSMSRGGRGLEGEEVRGNGNGNKINGLMSVVQGENMKEEWVPMQ